MHSGFWLDGEALSAIDWAWRLDGELPRAMHSESWPEFGSKRPMHCASGLDGEALRGVHGGSGLDREAEGGFDVIPRVAAHKRD